MPNRWWMWKLGGFVVAIGVAVMVLAAGTWTPAPAVAGLPDRSCDQAADSARTITTPDSPDGTEQACRIRPECDSDDDCDGICGPGLGNCIHNKCPIRICRCG